jgi:hypothetical protein
MIAQDLANLINSSYSDIVNSHIALGILSANGTLTGSINVDGDSDLASLQSLLDHVTAVQGACCFHWRSFTLRLAH